MNTEAAQELISISLRCSEKINNSISLVLNTCDEAHFHAYRRLAGRVMGYIFTEILQRVYQSNPDLDPDRMKSDTGTSDSSSIRSYIAGYKWPPSGPMQRKIAEAIVVTLGEVACELEGMMKYIREHCDRDEVLGYCEGIGEVLEHLRSAEQMIVDEHPDLKS